MQETNKLAFDCLMKDQLVFPTDSITNPDVLLLGLLSVTKTATPHGKKSLAQFAHKTLQEYAAGGHVATEYINGRPAAWEKVTTAFTELFAPTVESTRKRQRKTNQNGQFADAAEQHVNTISSTVKFIEAIMRSPKTSIRKMAKIMLDKGFYDDDPDLPTLRQALKNLEETKDFTDEEFNAFFDYGMHFQSLADSEQKKKLKQRASNLLNNNFDAKKLAMILSLMTTLKTACMKTDQDGAIEVLSTNVESMLSTTMVSPQEATKSAKWLQDQANSMKILLRFILGKLRAHQTAAEQVLKDVARLLLDHAYHRSSGEVMSLHFIKQYLLDLMLEAGIAHEFPIDALYVSDMMRPCNVVPCPLVVHINSSTSLESLPDITMAKALKLENVMSSLSPVILNMRNLKAVELQNISVNVLKTHECKKLANAWSSSGSFVYLVLESIQDVSVCYILVKNLPPSTMRLTILNCASSGKYQFPDTVNLECLHLEGQLSDVTKMFASHFQKLVRLTIMNTCQKKWKGIRSLLSAVREGRMPVLQHLCIRFANLSNHGRDILEIAEKCKLQTVDLMHTHLSLIDGLAMLDLLNLPSIQSVNLLHNRGLNHLVPILLDRGNQQQINILCAETKSTSSSSWWSLVFHLGYKRLSKTICTIQ